MLQQRFPRRRPFYATRIAQKGVFVLVSTKIAQREGSLCCNKITFGEGAPRCNRLGAGKVFLRQTKFSAVKELLVATIISCWGGLFMQPRSRKKECLFFLQQIVQREGGTCRDKDFLRQTRFSLQQIGCGKGFLATNGVSRSEGFLAATKICYRGGLFLLQQRLSTREVWSFSYNQARAKRGFFFLS